MEQISTFSVIVAEDEELILNNIAKKIIEAGLGFAVTTLAADGKAALEAVERLPPDVLITDIRMPVMDGLELLKAVTTGYPFIKKIVISGHDDFNYAQQAIKYDVTDYLLKPLKLDDLKAALTRIKIMLENEKNPVQKNRFAATAHQTNSAEDIVRTVELYLRENYASDVNFDEIARQYNFSSSYLSKIFTKYFGSNPTKYLISLRINMAKHLLLSKQDSSIKEIGERVGYPDQFYFSRIFKSMMGVSPAQYKSSTQLRP